MILQSVKPRDSKSWHGVQIFFFMGGWGVGSLKIIGKPSQVISKWTSYILLPIASNLHPLDGLINEKLRY